MSDVIQFDPALKQLLLQTTGNPIGETIPEDVGVKEVPIVVRLVDPDIATDGLKTVTRFGKIVTGRVRLDRIVALRQNPNVISLKASATFGSALAFSVPEIHASAEFLQEVAPPSGVTGRGVVIGFLDWGCDFAHANLRNPQGGTRLLYLWDQRGGPQPNSPSPFNYGRLFTREQIDAALAQPDPYLALGYDPAQSDPDGVGTHCTHVMDIAAGNGRSPGSSPGVAPEADLICVHLKGNDTLPEDTLGDSVRVLEALRFIIDYAGDRPLVINLSLGMTGGPHDGTLLLSQALDSWVTEKPGRMVVMSAGNYFDSNLHSTGQILLDGRTDLHWRNNSNDGLAEMEIWYQGNDRFSIELIDPYGNSLGLVALGDDHVVRNEDKIIASIYHRQHDPNNGDHQVDIFLWPDAPSGIWTTHLYGEEIHDGHYHAWIERTRPSTQAYFEPESSNPACTTGTICNGMMTIAVGAYDARLPSYPLAHFSSAGPTRDGRPVPVISAPGVAIRAARSSFPTPAGRIMNDLTIKSGTSMAAPHVSGVVALMFEAAGNHRLTAEQTREILMTTARTEPSDTQYQRYGVGRVDAAAAVRRVRELLQDQVRHKTISTKESEVFPLHKSSMSMLPNALEIQNTRQMGSVRLHSPPSQEMPLQKRKVNKMNNDLQSEYSPEQRVYRWLISTNGFLGETYRRNEFNDSEFELNNSSITRSDSIPWLLKYAPEAIVQFQKSQSISEDSPSVSGPVVTPLLATGFLKDIPNLQTSALIPTKHIVVEDGWSNARRALARTYNRLGGLINALAHELSIEIASVLAVWLVESGGRAHTSSQAIIRFENHLFFRLWGQKNLVSYNQHFRHGSHNDQPGRTWENHEYRYDTDRPFQSVHTGKQSDEYAALNLAKQLAGDTVSLQCISIGGPQILVSNYRLLGYRTPTEMYDAFQSSERWHVLGFFDFCRTKPAPTAGQLIGYLRERNWNQFSHYYNGLGQVSTYSEWINNAYQEACKLPLSSIGVPEST